jgi:hypothetical protein
MEDDETREGHGEHGEETDAEPVRQRRTLDPRLALLLRTYRRAYGMSLRRASSVTGVSSGMLCGLEKARRAPSVVTVEMLIRGYRMSDEDAKALRTAGLRGVGKDW